MTEERYQISGEIFVSVIRDGDPEETLIEKGLVFMKESEDGDYTVIDTEPFKWDHELDIAESAIKILQNMLANRKKRKEQ